MNKTGKSPSVLHVDLQPAGRRIDVLPGETLLAAAQKAGIELVSVCGGMGICSGCRVRLASGLLSPLTFEEQEDLTQEEIEQGIRLACQAVPQSDVRIDIPPASLTAPQRLQVEGEDLALRLDPAVHVLDLHLDPPTVSDLRSDSTRLVDAVAAAGYPPPDISLPMLSELSDLLREHQWAVRLAVRTPEPARAGSTSELAAVLPLAPAVPSIADLVSPTPSRLLGLAVDVGTTKLAAYLVDLSDGRTLAKLGAMNPQIGYGEDVVSRILYTNEHSGGLALLQKKLIDALNQMVVDLCSQSSASPSQVVEAVVVGNTAMHHLLAGLPVRQLGVSPYVAAVSEPLSLAAHSIGLALAGGARVYLPPNIAGYVGADHVAMLMGAGLDERIDTDHLVIALDIGTNTEISLVGRGQVLSCSTASGPAFEGAHIAHGMRAAPGAIEHIQILDSQVHYQTIGGSPAVGICGSGILDAVAEILKAGVVDARGNFSAGHPLVRPAGKSREVLLVPAQASGTGRDVTVTRKDVNEIQLAKGAIRTGIEVLLSTAGVDAGQVDEWVIAGAFGTYLDLRSAQQIGLFPRLPLERFRQVGNAAGTGARQMLLSVTRRQHARDLAQRIRYLELTIAPDFTNQFIKAIMFE